MSRDDLLRELARRAGMTDAEVAGYLEPNATRPDLNAAIVVTCMGRLHHLSQTLPAMVEHTPAPIVLVDWSCPDHCGDWARERWPERVHVVERPGHRYFHKTAALNTGLAYAGLTFRMGRAPGFLWLLVLDADTRPTEHLWPWLSENVEPGPFYVAAGHSARPDLSGLLLVRAHDFYESGGYDERMIGWGAEDWDMRCRLHFKLGLPYVTIPAGFADPLHHGDELRHRYQEGAKDESYRRNYRLLDENLKAWTGRALHETDPRVLRELFGGFW